MEQNWMELLGEKNQLEQIMKENEYSEQYGLTISREEAQILTAERKQSLQEQKRVEFGASILPKIIHAFCDSDYLDQESYVPTLIRLQDTFYLYKNEMLDEITDDELLHFMREQFDEVCFGDMDYLESTCLAVFARAIRAGYQGYKNTEGFGEYTRLDEMPRWSRELFLEALSELTS